MRFLVVDDVGYSRLLVSRVLEKQGHEVLSAGSGAEALNLLRTGGVFDAVISDLMMPSMDGFELIEKAGKIQLLKDKGYISCPPFILLTASDDRNLLSRAQELGFVDVLLKPLDPERLMESINLATGNMNAEAEDDDEDLQKYPTLSASLVSLREEMDAIIEKQDKDKASVLIKHLKKMMSDFSEKITVN
jgi:CheY-like chemotaxis protein